MFVILVQAHCNPLYIQLILCRFCCAEDGTKAHLASPFPKVGLERKPYRSVRQPGCLPTEALRLCTPTLRRVCPFAASLEMRLRLLRLMTVSYKLVNR